MGGGSSIDTAKAVGILATNGGDIREYYGNNKVKNPILPLVAVPTTAGTGSEVTPSAVIGDTAQNKVKFPIRSELIRPKVAVLDPTLLRSLPRRVAAICGMDALTHAVESFVSLGSNPFTEVLSLEAIRLIGTNLRRFVSEPANLDAASPVMFGSTMAGIAFSIGRLGNVHCMARPLEEKLGLEHGLACAVLLPHVIEFNIVACPPKFARIAQTMGGEVKGLTDLEAARILLELIRKLNSDLLIPSFLGRPHVSSDEIEEMARFCSKTNYNEWNPRHTEFNDFVNLFEKAILN